jgi:hypothetical protein
MTLGGCARLGTNLSVMTEVVFEICPRRLVVLLGRWLDRERGEVAVKELRNGHVALLTERDKANTNQAIMESVGKPDDPSVSDRIDGRVAGLGANERFDAIRRSQAKPLLAKRKDGKHPRLKAVSR